MILSCAIRAYVYSEAVDKRKSIDGLSKIVAAAMVMNPLSGRAFVFIGRRRDQSRFLASLQSLRGDEFDREYARQQVLAHTSALTMLHGYADKGSDANLRRWATSSAPTIEHHLQTARELFQSFNGS